MGPLAMHILSGENAVAEGIARQYAHHVVLPEDMFCDFHVEVRRPSSLRRWWRPQAHFLFDGLSLFNPLPADQAFPLLEWGLNWCISSHCHQYLIIHAAVVALEDRALILPAPPGSGKSTLCAGLVQRGWRLLSDELAIIEPATCNLVAVPRPISLKNASIDVIREFSPDAVLNPPVYETIKGTVTHMRPPATSVRDSDRRAHPAWIVLPRFEAGSPTTMTPITKAEGLMMLAENAFNYSVHDRSGFIALSRLVSHTSCFRFQYSRLEEAIELFGNLAKTGA